MGTTETWVGEYLTLVDKLWEEGSYKEGRAVLEKVFYEAPDCAKAHSYAGWYAKHELENKELAAEHYAWALQFDPSYVHNYLLYAELLIENKDVKTYEGLKEAGLEQADVDKAELLSSYGKVLEVSGRYREAAAAYKEAMRHTLENWKLDNIKADRKRARAKYRWFSAVYSLLF